MSLTDLDKRGKAAEAPTTFAEEWAALCPRPMWDDPEYWASARPVHEDRPNGLLLDGSDED